MWYCFKIINKIVKCQEVNYCIKFCLQYKFRLAVPIQTKLYWVGHKSSTVGVSNHMMETFCAPLKFLLVFSTSSEEFDWTKPLLCKHDPKTILTNQSTFKEAKRGKFLVVHVILLAGKILMVPDRHCRDNTSHKNN